MASVIDTPGMKPDYLDALKQFRTKYKEDCAKAGIDFVAMDTSIGFDKALLEYLLRRQRRYCPQRKQGEPSN